MMFSAHRISGELPVKDALLPLFWAFDSLARRIASVQPKEPVIRPLATGTLPSPDKAMKSFERGSGGPGPADTAELAAVSLSRLSVPGRRRTCLAVRLPRRRQPGTQSNCLANIWRSLDSVGWEHAEIPLRYMLGGSPHAAPTARMRAAADLPRNATETAAGLE